jgi:hypothetical protein
VINGGQGDLWGTITSLVKLLRILHARLIFSLAITMKKSYLDLVTCCTDIKIKITFYLCCIDIAPKAVSQNRLIV